MSGRAAVVQVALGGALLAAGLVAVGVGVLPGTAVAALVGRTLPVLGFVVAVTVVAGIAAASGVFDVVADAAARLARGRTVVLWLLVAGVALVATVFLSLDTTAVLLTPVVVTLARRVGLDPVPFAVLTVWIANVGSLLLPVSNLTNLLAAPSFGGSFTARTWLPALVAVLVPVGILSAVHRRILARRFEPIGSVRPPDRVLLGVTAAVLVVLLPALAVGEPVLGVPVWVPATAAALVLLGAAAVRRPQLLSPGLLPLPLVVFVCGLFLAVTALGRLGLTEALTVAAGTGTGPVGLLRLAGVGTVAANAVDNLPAYLSLEPVAGGGDRLVALLVAVNAGPLITPWASLATLLWHGRLAAMGVEVRWGRFALLGLLAAPLTVAAAVLAV